MEFQSDFVVSVAVSLMSSALKNFGLVHEVVNLKKTVEYTKDVLAEAERNQDIYKDMYPLISKLTQALYEADDSLDQLNTQRLLRMRDERVMVRVFSLISTQIVFQPKIASIINTINKRLDSVAENKSKFQEDRRVASRAEHEETNWRKRRYLTHQKEVTVGREGNKNDIIDLLLNNNNGNQNVSLVAIVGIGGVGKTVLAQLVYDDPEVEGFFDKRMWLCVSQDFDVKALGKNILELSTGNYVEKDYIAEDDQQLQLLLNKFEENLNSQKYLLVLDDVWDEDSDKWLLLTRFLKCGAQGSKILLTTRDQTVANKMGVEMPYFLKGLTNDQSWTLFNGLASEVNLDLESIGKKVVEKCVGVPLAIRAIVRLLQRQESSDWEAVFQGHFWLSCEHNSSLMPILKLSYHDLPIGLKQCFVYCSLYPKGCTYKKDELIDLWMAQGFLEDEDKEKCLKDIGEEYVHILLMKSFLKDVEKDELDEIKYFKMHDLMHALSLSIAHSSYALYVGGVGGNVASCPIHASFEEYQPPSLQDTLDLSQLRTCLGVKEKYQGNSFDLFGLKHLRHLDLSYYKMRDLPSIGNMSHLRYLNLCYCYELTCLPKSISNLVNLQTLRLNWCGNLNFLLKIITELINLCRLDIEGCKAFEDGMPIGLCRMTRLQSLSHFIVGAERERAKLNELKELNLRGGLTIQYLGSIRDVERESKDVDLIRKKKLISLTLKWGLHSEMKNNDSMQLLENLCPPQNLKALTIEDYPGLRLSNWLLSCTNLVKLKFSNMRNCQYMEALEGLVSLKTLHIHSMHKLEYIRYTECSSTKFFASLEELKIWRCKSLKAWQREANDQNTRDNECYHPLPQFSCLSSLQINCCPNLSCMPTFPTLVRHLELAYSSTKPLLDTLNVSIVGPSTSNHVAASLSKLKSLHIEGIDIEELPEEWMQNLSSLELLSIANFSSSEKPFHHMQKLSATLEKFTIRYLHSWNGDEDYNIQCQDLRCLQSLQTIVLTSCDHLMALPKWICDLQSLRFIHIQYCQNLESFPEGMHRLTNLQTLLLDGAPLLKRRCDRGTGAEWPKIAHIPNIWIDLQQI